MSRPGLALGAVLAGCHAPASSTVTPAPVAPPAEPCLADGLGALSNPGELEVACYERGRSCADACEAGDPHACMQVAYVRERERDHAAASAAYEGACRGGLAIGCTNLGAHLWLVARPSTPAHATCARRLFERSCETGEEFGCGMIGRMLSATATTPAERDHARKYFHRVCADVGAMTCRMYAFHLEAGELGPPNPLLVRQLLERACATGDAGACGRATARETFVAPP